MFSKLVATLLTTTAIAILLAAPTNAQDPTVRDLSSSPGMGRPTQQRVGPSFDCYSPQVAQQPLPQVICSNDELARLDVAYVNVYQAVRHTATEQERRLLVSEANAFVEMVIADCKIPKTGWLSGPASSNLVDCIRTRYEAQRQIMLRRLSSQGVEEARVTPQEAAQVQEALKVRGLLSESTRVDGVLGPATRAAIGDFQRSAGLNLTGFASQEVVAILLRKPAPPAPAPTPPVPPTAITPSTPTPVAEQPTALTPVAERSTAEFNSQDIPRIVDNSRNNEIRFNRDYKGHTFSSDMKFKSATESPFLKGRYRISFAAVDGKGQVDCVITDEKVLSIIADWPKGRPASVSGVIDDTTLGDVQLSNCIIR